jgi:hypothetical protein
LEYLCITFRKKGNILVIPVNVKYIKEQENRYTAFFFHWTWPQHTKKQTAEEIPLGWLSYKQGHYTFCRTTCLHQNPNRKHYTAVARLVWPSLLNERNCVLQPLKYSVMATIWQKYKKNSLYNIIYCLLLRVHKMKL